jgi:hypothetical protein
MGPMNDDDEMITRPAATMPVRSDSLGDPGAAGAGAHAGEPGKSIEGVDEMPGMPGTEEAGYGHGV